MAGKKQQTESVIIRNLRIFKDKYFTNAKNSGNDQTVNADITCDEEAPGFLDSLPPNLHFLIMTLLSPADLCHLGATNRYWRAVVRDPVLWRYFLLRDMPHWPSIDYTSMPDLMALEAPLCDDEKGGGPAEHRHDFMTDYLRGCPGCRQRCPPPQRQPYEVVTHLLQSLVPSAEPRYAMFGPGMEQLDVSMVTRLMHAPDVLPMAGGIPPMAGGIPQCQINGIGSGISYIYKKQHKFNILTLYSTNRAEREKARLHGWSATNKLFVQEGVDQSGCPVFHPAPQVQDVCQAVDGFIYVANAEPGKGGGEQEGAHIRAVLDPAWGLSSRPLLVLSCISREPLNPSSSSTRTPCLDMADGLGLPRLLNPWMVQDTVAESLSGLLGGVAWLLSFSGVRL